jgi:hypothetical protein
MDMAVRFLDAREVGRFRQGINSDPEFNLAAKFFSKDILLIVGASRCMIRVRDGAISEIMLNPTVMDPWSFFIKASPESWEKFLQPLPPPYYTGLYSGIPRQTFEVGGDLESAFAHYWAVSRMLDLLRELQNK